MGLCGQRAHSRLKPGEGNAAYRCNIIDEIFNLDKTTLQKGADYEVYDEHMLLYAVTDRMWLKNKPWPNR
jgi:hypothetical protein